MTLEKTREKLRRLVVAVERSSDHSIMEAADTYALASRLAGHVAACEEYVFVEPTTVDPSQWIPCGQEDMYCDDAKEILEK